tara:strand:- start:566 stop:994 length:429 start_codon:yes stop_codon:yes gene_type:complete
MYTLDFYECEKNLKKYGKSLVTAMPKETTHLLMELCTEYKCKGPGASSSSSASSTPAMRHDISGRRPNASPLGAAGGSSGSHIVSSILEKVGVDVDNNDNIEIEELRLDDDDDLGMPGIRNASVPGTSLSTSAHKPHVQVRL